MYIVLLKFSVNKDRASNLMANHNAWLKSGFDEGIFYLAGGIASGMGGGIIAHGVSLSELETKLNEDPFVIENVVTPEIIEITPGKVDERLNCLLG